MQEFSRYAKVYEELNRKKPYKREIEFIYDWAGKPKKIFDVGCGTANYWKYFPKSVIMSGMDKSIDMINQSNENISWGDILKPTYFTNTADCVTALFDVVNYLPHFKWVKHLPLKKDGLFIFDAWDVSKVHREGFLPTVRTTKSYTRKITPTQKGNKVNLLIEVSGKENFKEKHTMYLHTIEDMISSIGSLFKLDDLRFTDRWQTWFKFRRIR